MITLNELQEAFETIKQKPKFQKQLEFAALLTEYLEQKGIQPIVVGGLSVEIYTRNDYHTHDIDFVSDGWHLFDEVLTHLGFRRIEREWYHTEAEIAIEVPNNTLDGSLEHVYEITLPSERKIYVIGAEDIIIHRIEGIAFSKSYPKEDEDYEWAYRMFLIHRQNLDHDYLIKEAKRLKIFHLIEEWYEQQP